VADKTISDLTAATSIASGDLIEIENAGGNSRKVTASNAAKSFQSLAFRGCLVTKSADQTAANFTTGTALTFNTELYDTDAIHDTSSNTSRLTVPSGVSYVQVSGNIFLSNVTASEDVYLDIRKNGVQFVAGLPNIGTRSSLGFPRASIISSPMAVSPGDYFELFLTTTADTSITVTATGTWFAMQILG
jgi:hypothetical protein